MKKLFSQILCTLLPIIIVSAFGAVVGVWANDKLQDSKIDMLIKTVDRIALQVQEIKDAL
jgi:hypothetical protein